MKKSCILLLASVFFSFSYVGFAQGAKLLVKDVVVKAEQVDTPDWSCGNVPQKLSKPSKWIQLEADFVTGLSGKGEWLDDPVVEWEVLLPTEDPKRPYVLVTGKVEYWAFALDGKDHHIVALIPPRIMQRYTPDKKYSATEVKKLDVKITFKFNDADIGFGFQTPKGKSINESVDKFKQVKLMPSIPRVKDAILDTDKTPWAYLNFDYYEQLKTGGTSK